jgi:molybdopterin adenylyltransferase
VSRRTAEDRSGPALAAAAEAAGCAVEAMEVVPDDYSLIEDRLNHYVDAGYEVILTTGGTGLTQDDLTPDATRVVVDREIPGIAEALRAESLRHTNAGMLSRAVAGAAGRTLIVNLPGSPRAVEQLMAVLGPVLPHAVSMLGGSGGHRAH